jgi:hypothetical protein
VSCSFDPLGLAPKDDPAAWKEIQTKELNNGRLAMIAIAAFTAEELVSKQEIFEHLALRFEKEAILELDDIERDVGINNVSAGIEFADDAAFASMRSYVLTWCNTSALSCWHDASFATASALTKPYLFWIRQSLVHLVMSR